MEKVFLDIEHLGSGGCKKDVSTYFIGERWREYGTDEFNPPSNPRTKDTRKDRGWGAIWADDERRKELKKKQEEGRRKKKNTFKCQN